MHKKKPPSYKKGGVQALGLNTPQTVAPPKPRQQAKATKPLKQKTRRSRKRTTRVFKDICREAYHAAGVTINAMHCVAVFTIIAISYALTAMTKGAVRLAANHKEQIIKIILLFIALCLELFHCALSMLRH